MPFSDKRQTALWFASTLALILTCHDLDVNKASTDGLTPLFVAIMFQHLDIIKLLLLLSYPDIDINRSSNDGHSPLYLASAKGFTDVVNLVLSRSDINVNWPDHDGVAPLTRYGWDISIGSCGLCRPSGYRNSILPQLWWTASYHSSLGGDVAMLNHL